MPLSPEEARKLAEKQRAAMKELAEKTKAAREKARTLKKEKNGNNS